MNPYRPHRLMVVPPTLHARMEIAKAIQTLTAQEADHRARRQGEITALRRELEEIPELLRRAFAECRVLLAAELRKYSSDEPRVPKGNRRGGEWTKESTNATGTSVDGSGAPAENNNSRTDATVGAAPAVGAIDRPETNSDGRSVRALDWLQSGLDSAVSAYETGVGQYAEGEIALAQDQIQLAGEHPLAYAVVNFGAPVVIAAGMLAPELFVAGGTLEAGGVGGIAEGNFSIIEWTRYPVSLPKPSGPFRLLSGSEYDAARSAANSANRALRAGNPDAYAGKQIHEIQPVKFGGSPTDPVNKIALTPVEHAAATTWWNRLLRNLQ